MKNFIDDYINFILNNKILLILYISTLIIWIIKKIYKFILFYSKNEKKKKSMWILFISNIIIAAKYKIENDSKNTSYVKEIYNKKKKQYKKSSIIIVICIMTYFLKNMIFHTETKVGMLIFLYGLFALITIGRLLAYYRIERGFYGANYEESKEILHYLLEDQDKNNKISGKKIFNEIEDRNKSEEKLPVLGGKLEY